MRFTKKEIKKEFFNLANLEGFKRSFPEWFFNQLAKFNYSGVEDMQAILKFQIKHF